MLRDVGVGIVLVFLAFQLFAQAEKRDPAFAAGDIRIVEATVVGFTTAPVLEHAPAPNINTERLVSRSAMRLDGFPPNLLASIHGSRWQFENDIPVGTVVRLEVVKDPEALAARARAYPDATFLLPIEGLQIGERVYFRASDEIDRAADAAGFFRRLGRGAMIAALAWLGWIAWARRSEIRRLVDMAREAS